MPEGTVRDAGIKRTHSAVPQEDEEEEDMRALFFMALAIPLGAQSLRVTASPLSTADVSALFGPLNKTYGGARVDVCYSGSDARSIPLAVVRQQLKLTNGIVILSNVEALTVISKAQSSTKKAIALRVGLGIVELGAIASTFSQLSSTIKNTLAASALAGGETLGVIQTTTTAYAMVSYSAVALPETLNFSTAQQCVPQGIQLTEMVPGGGIDFTMTLPKIKVPEETLPGFQPAPTQGAKK
jgi:hypothetical protein